MFFRLSLARHQHEAGTVYLSRRTSVWSVQAPRCYWMLGFYQMHKGALLQLPNKKRRIKMLSLVSFRHRRRRIDEKKRVIKSNEPRCFQLLLSCDSGKVLAPLHHTPSPANKTACDEKECTDRCVPCSPRPGQVASSPTDWPRHPDHHHPLYPSGEPIQVTPQYPSSLST